MTVPRLQLSTLALALAIVACAAPRAPRVHAAAPGDNAALLQQAEEELARRDVDDARAALAGIAPAMLTPDQRTRWQVVQAEVALAEDKAVIALQALPPPGQVLDPALAVRADAARAEALFRTGDAIGATAALVARERRLSTPEERAHNHEFVWNGLRSTDLDTATGPRLVQADKTTRGWVEMAVISRSVWLDPRDLQARLAQWRAEYAGHPAEERIATLPQIAGPPARRAAAALALLLPLSGPHGGSAEAVRDGFFAAFYGAAAAERPAVRVYDTGTTPETLEAAHRAALDDGAEFLVGPLTKESVEALADSGRPPVPVLALNYLEPGREAPFNFFQWGLAPEDEARQAAERAITEHQYRAVALVPEGDWGSRVLRAFQERLEALGGAVIASRTYVATERDHSEPIRALLGIDVSDGRHNALTNALGIRTQFQPRRREDVDLVFIAARTEQARLLGPQLRFHRAGDLPVYATSLIYDGEPPAADLNGLRFCDMPWMLSPEGELAALRSQLRTLFPSRPRDYARLLALGHDAYTLVRLIDSGQLQPGSFFPAASGTLSLHADGVISRGLACAEIRNGALKPLDVSLAEPKR